MADETKILEIEARFKDFMSDNMDKLDEKLKELNASLQKANKSSSLFSAQNIKTAASIFGVKKMMQMAKDQIVAGVNAWEGQVQSTIKLARALGQYSKALEDQANALQKQTVYADDQILDAQANLVLLGLTEKQVLRLTPAVLDFAAATGQDLNSASTTVAKSLQGEVNILGRYGIAVKGSAKSSERFESALQGLTAAYKDQANTYTAGAGGLKEIAKLFGDVQEEVGKNLQPVLDNLTAWFKDSLPAITGLAIGFGKVVSTVFFTLKGAAGFLATGIVENFNLILKVIKFLITNANSALKLMPDMLVPDSVIKGLDNASNALGTFNNYLSDVSSELKTDYIDNFKAIYDVWSKPVKINMPAVSGKGNPPTGESDEDRKKRLEKEKLLAEQILETARTLAEKRIEYSAMEAAYNLTEQDNKLQLIQIQTDKELALLEERYKAEQLQYKDNKEALKNLEQSYILDRNVIQLNQIQAEDEENKRKAEQAKTDLATRKAQQKELLASTAANFQAMASLGKVFGRAYQAVAIASTTISTIEAAQDAYKSAMKVIPPPFNFPAAIISAAAATGAGIARVNEIRKQKFATGGIALGNNYSGDKVPALLNSKEMVLTTTQQANLLNLANGNGTANNSSKVEITLNLPNGKIDSSNISDVKMSLDTFAKMYLDADRTGRLDRVKNRR
jgi:hypothetical protein